MRRSFNYSLLVGFILLLAFHAAVSAPAVAGTIHHYEYVLTSGFIYVYDMDNGGTLVKTLTVPTTAGVRGAVASAATGMLYISYGSDSGSGGFQLAYNLSTDQVAWTMSYSHGVDSQSISPDGKTIYMPSGELSSGGTWYVEDSTTGNDIGTINTNGTGPHNTIVSPSGLHVYMGDRDYNLSSSAPGVNDFSIASTATNQIIGTVSPLKSGARPFTINSKETFSFNTITAFMGFQVGDLTTGNVLYTVTVDGSNIPGYTTQTSATIPSHGVSLSPDDKELYLVDQPNSYVHVFDVSGLPASPPVQVADIPLLNAMSGNQAECAYDCLRDGWVQHSRDGRFVVVGDSGDVIDTLTRKTIATMPALLNSRVEIEIDFQDSTPIWAATSRSGVGYANPLPPTFTARITSPDLGSTVSGANVAVTTSVIDGVSISSVDLSVDGTLYASTTTSPYSFSWDTTKVANGSHTLMITANDSAGNTTSFSAAFTTNNVNTPNPPSITTASLPGGTQNMGYSATLAASGGVTPYTWSIASGTLPAGLALAPTTGAFSGTPTASGTSNFTVQVTDANSQAATKPLSLTIAAVTSGAPPSITTASLSGGKQNVAYSATLAASGGTTPYAWSIVSGTLPAGLALAPATGAISGTPTASGTSNFTVQVKDANSQTATKSLSLNISATSSGTPPSIATTSLPGGTQSAAYNSTLAATGGVTPYAWSIVSGSLPAGLALAPATGAISGTPTASGTSNFTVQVKDANSHAATKALSLTIAAATSGAPPSITTTSLPGGTQKLAYSAALAATGGAAPYTWSIISGTLPTGLALAPGTGAITGTPTASGTSNFTVQVKGADSQAATKSLSLTVAPAGAPTIVATGGTPQRAIIGTAFGTTLKVTVKDSNGNALAGVTVTFTAPAETGPSGTFAGGVNTATTNASGVATSAVFTANKNAGGPYNVTASATGTATDATFSFTNVDFDLAQSAPGAVQLTAGTPGQVALILTTMPTGSTLPADVNLTCAAEGSVSTTTCSVSPAKISANSPSGSTATLTITSTASLPPSLERRYPQAPSLPWTAIISFAGFLAIYFAARHRTAPLPGRMAYAMLALLMITSAGLMGCVGLTSAQSPSSGVTVTATSGGVSKTMTVSFKVK